MAKKYPGRTRLLTAIGIFGLLNLFPMGHLSFLLASPQPDDLNVRLKAEVSIVTDQQMDFGQLADRSGSVTLGLGDSIIADPDHIHHGGAPYSGIYSISGDPSTAVDISISTSSSDGFTLSDFSSSEGNLPLIGVVLNAGGDLVLTVGAILTLDDITAIIGSGQTISFTITSTYN